MLMGDEGNYGLINKNVQLQSIRQCKRLMENMTFDPFRAVIEVKVIES